MSDNIRHIHHSNAALCGETPDGPPVAAEDAPVCPACHRRAVAVLEQRIDTLGRVANGYLAAFHNLPTGSVGHDLHVIVEGGLVQNDPALPVFDLDVLDSDFVDDRTIAEIEDLRSRALDAGLWGIVERADRTLAEYSASDPS